MFERKEKDIEELLQKGKVFYKFSKSSEEQKEIFHEPYFIDYPENSIINANGQHGISLCDDTSKLLRCIWYGDVLTQVIVDTESPYYNDVNEHLYKELDEYNKYCEYVTFTGQIGKNYSLKDPTVLNELIQKTEAESINVIFMSNKGKFLEDIYDKMGYTETVQFLRNLKDEMYKRSIFPMSARFHADEIKEISAELVKNYEHKFSFEKAEKEYETIKEDVVDRRREPAMIIKNDKDINSIATDIAIYLQSNRFSTLQSTKIIKIMFAAGKMNKNDINQILPRFINTFTEKQLDDIKNFAFKNIDTKELLNYIDEIFKDNIPAKKLSLAEKIGLKFKESQIENSQNYKHLIKEIVNRPPENIFR